MIALLIPLVGRLGLPERFQRIAAWVIVVVAAIALLWAGWAILTASIVNDYKQEQAARSIEATNRSAEQRADDAIRNVLSEKEREAAIAEAALKEAQKPEAERAKLPPTTVALNCKRLEQAYSAAELARMKDYREVCK